jgi:hypothetical protein
MLGFRLEVRTKYIWNAKHKLQQVDSHVCLPVICSAQQIATYYLAFLVCSTIELYIQVQWKSHSEYDISHLSTKPSKNLLLHLVMIVNGSVF